MCVDGVERSPSAKASAEVCGAREVETRGAIVAVVVDAEIEVLVSLTPGTAEDLCALGTLWKVLW